MIHNFSIQNGVFGGNTIGTRISARFSGPHNSSTRVSAKGKAVPVHDLDREGNGSQICMTNLGLD